MPPSCLSLNPGTSLKAPSIGISPGFIFFWGFALSGKNKALKAGDAIPWFTFWASEFLYKFIYLCKLINYG